MGRMGIGVCCVVGLVLASSAHADTLVAALSTHRVMINSTYTGAHISVFGAIENSEPLQEKVHDAVITIRGPRQAILVRQKELLGPLWINRTQRRFFEAPGYLAVVASKPFDALADEKTRSEVKLGLDAILRPDRSVLDAASELRFRDALRRLQEGETLYSEDTSGVTFHVKNVFQATVSLPAHAPPGSYDVEVVTFFDGKVNLQNTLHFDVQKTGFEEAIATVAHEHMFIYGLTTAAIALLFGWAASVIFRRD